MLRSRPWSARRLGVATAAAGILVGGMAAPLTNISQARAEVGAAQPPAPDPATPGTARPPVQRLQQTLILGGMVARDALGPGGGAVTSWDQARAAIAAEFRPTATLLTTDGKAVALGRQLTSAEVPRSGPATVATAASEPTGELDVTAQVEATQRAYEKPSASRAVELAATVAADGKLISVEVTFPSGSARFDEAATTAVQRGLREHPVLDERYPGRSTVARFRVSATRAVTLPRVAPVREPQRMNGRVGTRGLTLGGRLLFDETTGSARLQKPFSDELSSQIELLSVTPEPAPEPAPAPRPAAP